MATCPKCGSNNAKFQRESTGRKSSGSGVKLTKSISVGGAKTSYSHRTIGICQDCGYTWTNSGKGGSNKIWLWILGWIVIFPLPLTIILLKRKDIKPALKYGGIITAWIVYILIGIVGNTNNSTTSSTSDKTEVSVETTDITNEPVQNIETATAEGLKDYELIDNFIDKYNSTATTPISSAVEIDISKDSEHYRTEYRLPAFQNAVAKQAVLGSSSIDIIAYGGLSNTNLRLYVLTDSEDFAVEVFTNVAKLMYPDVTAIDLDNAIKELKERDNAAYLDKLSFYYIHSYKELFIDNIAIN